MVDVWIWFGVLVAALVIEAITAALVSVWFVPASLISLVLALFDVKWWIQLIVFFGVSLLMLIFLRPITRKFLKLKKTATNSDKLIGTKVVITEKVDNIQSTGCGKADGKVWTVRSDDDNVTFEPGDIVTVIEIQGVRLICSNKKGE